MVTMEKLYSIQFEYLNAPSLKCLDDVIGSQEMHPWNFLQPLNVPVISFHSHGFLSTEFKPCNTPVLFYDQREREGRWWRTWWWRWWLEEANSKECGLRKENVKQESVLHLQLIEQLNGVAYQMESVMLENSSAPWLVVLYNLWSLICQMVVTGQIKLGKFRSDGDLTWHMLSKNFSLEYYPSGTFLSETPTDPSNGTHFKTVHTDLLMAFVDAL